MDYKWLVRSKRNSQPNNKNQRALEQPMEISTKDEGYLTRKQVASLLKKSVRTVDNWHKHGDLPMVKIGRSVLFKWSDVVAEMGRRRSGEGKTLNAEQENYGDN